MQRTLPVFTVLLLVTVLFFGLTAPLSAQSTDPAADSPSANPIVNIAHFAPFAENPAGTSVTISVNGSDVFTEVVFGDTVVGLSVLPAGVYTVEIKPTGTDTVAMSGTFTLEADREYTILAIGDNSANMPLELEAIVKPVMARSAGDAMVLIGHYAPFAPTVPATAVDICNDATNTVLLPNVPYGVNSGYLALPAGIYDLSIALPGTSCAGTAYDLPALQFNAGEFYDAFAIGKNNVAYPLNVVSLSGLDFPPAIVNVAHFAPFAGDTAGTSVTIAVNGTDTFTEVVFADTVTGVELPAGMYMVEIKPTGSNTVAMSGTFPLESNKEYSLLAVGDGSQNMPLELKAIVKDAVAPTPGNAKVLIGHYAPFAATVMQTAVDLCNDADGGKVAGPLPYGLNSGYVEFPAGIYDLSIALAGTNCAGTAYDLPALQFNAGEFYDAFAIGKNNAAYPLNVVSLSGLDFPAMATIGHFAPFAGTVAGTAVDIRVNGQVAFTNVVYGRFVPDVVIPSGDVFVEILTPAASAAAGEVNNAVILSGTFTLGQMSEYVLFAIGGANGWAPSFAAAEISQTVPAGKAFVTLGHLAPFAPTAVQTAVDICIGGVPIPDLTNLQYPGVLANLPLDPGLYDLAIAVHGTNCTTEAIDVPPFRLREGDNFNAFAIGAPEEVAPSAGPEFPLTVISTTGLRAAYEQYLPSVSRAVAE